MTGASRELLRTAILAVGLGLAGWFACRGFARGRSF
jgi:hypothetical protein